MEIKGEVSRKARDPRNKRRGPRDPLCARLCASRKRFVLGEVKQYDGGKGRGHGPLALPRLPHREFVTGELIVG